jgi:NADPH-dependent 2,4-dienoyl-CoA reductase/sulfur reductase-like enzyme
MQHVIIGAGPAGVIAAETLHKLDPGSRVVIVGDEPEPPYSRMAIPYYLIDRIDERGTYLRKNDGHFAALNTEVRHGRVTAVDTKAGKVKLESGDDLAYDRLLIASGSHPVSPPISGVDLPNVHPCWTLEDARGIAALAKPGAKVVLMGAGFIGCIILEALAARGVDLTVVEMENRMVPRMMNDTAGGLIKRWCESKGVKVFTSTKVKSIESGKAKQPLKLTLDDGQSLEADLVISATGVRPNVAFLEGSGIKTDFGVVVDEYLKTSVDGVYAAGDVAEGKDFSTGGYSVQAIQPTAADHGRIAATNMAGRKAHHQGSVNLNVLDTMGLVSSSFGLWAGVDGGDSAEQHDPDRFAYLNLQFQDDVLVGASSLGLTEHVGVLRGLIQSKTRLGGWKKKLMDNPNRIMEAYLGSTQAVGYNAHVL